MRAQVTTGVTETGCRKTARDAGVILPPRTEKAQRKKTERGADSEILMRLLHFFTEAVRFIFQMFSKENKSKWRPSSALLLNGGGKKCCLNEISTDAPWINL